MAVRVDTSLGVLRDLFVIKITSLKRAKTGAKNPLFVPILEKEIIDLERAMMGMTEVK